MAKILAIINIKGGVGKTTSTANLAAAFSECGRKVLAVDLDPQASLTFSLGIDPSTVPDTIADVLDGRAVAMNAIIVSTQENFDIVPSSHTLLDATIEPAINPVRVTIVKEVLEPLRNQYDYILLDCPAQAGVLTNIALTAADQVLVPFTPDYLSFKSLEWLIAIIRRIQIEANPTLRVSGIFYSMHDLKSRHARQVLKLVEKSFGSEVPVLSAAIGQSGRLKDATLAGQTIFQYAPDSPVAESYRTLARELENGAQQLASNELPMIMAQAHEALAQKDLPTAYTAFRRVTELNPRLPDAWIGRAESTPIWIESIECYARALELEPREQPIRENLAALVINKLASSERLDAAELGTGAKILAAVEQNDLAESLFRRVTEIDSKNQDAWLARARMTQDVKDAVVSLNRCLEINPQNQDAQSALPTAKQRLHEETLKVIEQAAALLQEGRRDQAHAKYRVAAELEPANDEAWLGVARTAERLRDRLEYVDKALKVNPRNDEAREFYRFLHSFLVAPNDDIEPMAEESSRWRWLIPVGIIILAIAIALFALSGPR